MLRVWVSFWPLYPSCLLAKPVAPARDVSVCISQMRVLQTVEQFALFLRGILQMCSENAMKGPLTLHCVP